MSWLLLLEMKTVTWVQIPDKIVYVSHNVNALEKGMNLFLRQNFGKL